MSGSGTFLAGLTGARYLLADKGYDANALPRRLRQSAIVPVIPGQANTKRVIRYDKLRYKGRHLIENASCRLKDFRRLATRYDKLPRNFLSAGAVASFPAFWLSMSLDPNPPAGDLVYRNPVSQAPRRGNFVRALHRLSDETSHLSSQHACCNN